MNQREAVAKAFSNYRRYTWRLTMAIVAVIPACVDVQADSVSSSDNELVIRTTTPKWTGGIVPVCWDPQSTQRPNFATESFQVRTRATASWSAISQVNFIGWDVCPATIGNGVRIILRDDGAGLSGIGQGSQTMFLGTGGGSNGPFARGLIPHEFGHALGYEHEQTRPGFPDDPNPKCRENAIPSLDKLNTPLDHLSIMGPGIPCPDGSASEPNLWDAIGSKTAYNKRIAGMSVLTTGFHPGRGDHATVATNAGQDAVRGAGYFPAYANGWIFDSEMPGTVPLKLFWHAGRADNMSVSTTDGASAAINAGYAFIRDEGFVYPTAQPGTVPLKLFWSQGREDNFTTSTAAGEAAALAAGYVFVRNEGFVFSDRPYDILWRYFHGGRGDFLTTSQKSGLSQAAVSAGYTFVQLDGAVMRDQLPGTVPLKTFFHSGREDHFATATAAGEQDAIAAGYFFVGNEGFVFTAPAGDLRAISSLFHPGLADNVTSSFPNDASNAGYAVTRIEGFGLTVLGDLR